MPYEEMSVSYRNRNGSNLPHLASIVLGTLDLLRTGVVMISIRGQLLWANNAAEDILNAHDGLEVDADDFLLFSQGSRRFPIQNMSTASAVAWADDFGEPSIKYVPRPSGKRDLMVISRRTACFGESRDTQKPFALVFIHDPERAVRVSQHELRQLYGLTLTEGSVANFLMEGSTLEECCRRLAIRPSTARMHLRNLLNKTGSRSQGELVCLLFRNHGLMNAPPVPEVSIRNSVAPQKGSNIFHEARIYRWV
jgi:DNA-binding CsgD family transcriptional regulator